MLRQRTVRRVTSRWNLLHRFRRDNSGVTAIEFALVFPPFLMLIFGIFGVALFYMTETLLDRSLIAASRQIRTGQNQQVDLSVGQYKQQICSNTGGLVDCSKLSVIVLNENNWDNLTIPACVNDEGSVVASNYEDNASVSEGAGGRERVVFVLVCYPWQLLVSIPYLGLGNVNGGSAQLISAVHAFKSEPY